MQPTLNPKITPLFFSFIFRERERLSFSFAIGKKTTLCDLLCVLCIL